MGNQDPKGLRFGILLALPNPKPHNGEQVDPPAELSHGVADSLHILDNIIQLDVEPSPWN